MDANRADFGFDRQRPRLTAVVLPGAAPGEIGSLAGAVQIGEVLADVRVVVYARASDAAAIAGGGSRTVIAVPDDLAQDLRSIRRMAVQEPGGDVFQFVGGRARGGALDPARRSLKDQLMDAGVPHPSSPAEAAAGAQR